VTVHSQTLQGANVAVRKAGIARVVAAGAVTVGSPVNIAGSSGKVKAVSETAGTKIACLGSPRRRRGDGDVIEVFISLHERTA